MTAQTQTQFRIEHAHLEEMRTEIGERLRFTKQSMPMPSNLLRLLKRLDDAGHSKKPLEA